MGSEALSHEFFFLDPILGWVDLTMVLNMIFRTWFWTQWFSVHGFGCDGFWSMVLDAMVFGPWYWMLRHV